MNQENQSSQSWKPGWRFIVYLTATVLASALALAVNVAICYVLFTASIGFFPDVVAIYGGQFFLFVVPFMLLFLEWSLWDLLVDPFRGSK